MSVIYSFKAKKSDERNRDADAGNGPSFWVILLIVSGVMILMLSLFFYMNKAKTVPVPEPEKGLKSETGTRGTARKPSPKSAAEYKLVSANCALAEEHLKYDRPAQAKEAALKVLAAGIDEGDLLWGKAAAVLNKVNSLVISTDLPDPEKESYVVQKGDSLAKIASDSNTTIDLLVKCNGMSTTNPVIRPGKTIKVFKGNWKLEVSKKRFKLYVYKGEILFKVYNIGLGTREKTPAGSFEVDVKKKEPVWSKDGKQIPYGSKENILGTRWMSLKPASEPVAGLKSYGIHGTWAPADIGKENNVGCIMLDNDDINELYMIVPLHTTVIIGD